MIRVISSLGTGLESKGSLSNLAANIKSILAINS